MGISLNPRDAVSAARRQALALQRLAEKGRQPCAEQCQRQSGRILVGEQSECQGGEQQCQRRAGCRASNEAEFGHARGVSRAEACNRGNQHDPFDSQIDDAALLADDDADRCQQQWRTGGERGGDQCRNFVHRATMIGLRRTGRYMISVSQASR